jgi:hypothetical protein
VKLPAVLEELPAVLGNSDDLVPEPGQDLLKKIPHLRFVVGDDNPQSLVHTSPLGSLISICAPKGEPAAIARQGNGRCVEQSSCRAWLVPRALVVKHGSKITLLIGSPPLYSKHRQDRVCDA